MEDMGYFFVIKLCCLFCIVAINIEVEARNFQKILPKCPEIDTNYIKLQQELLQILPMEINIKPTIHMKFDYGQPQVNVLKCYMKCRV